MKKNQTKLIVSSVFLVLVFLIVGCTGQLKKWSDWSKEKYKDYICSGDVKYKTGDPISLMDNRGYPTDPTADIAWSAGFSGVNDIKRAIDNARETENQQLGTYLPSISLPSQYAWDTMSNSEKALHLVNEEREARGLKPLQDVEYNVMKVAQDYAEYLINYNKFSHSADGQSPWQRLDANQTIGSCREFLNIAENLAAFWSSGSVPLAVERAVYNWMYVDAKSSWGHRHCILWTPYNDNCGTSGKEGFLGIGLEGGSNYLNMGMYGVVVVMNVFDPCASWY